jgi:putative glutamine amidotransferase
MRWLMMQGPTKEATKQYVDWLSRLSIDAAIVHSGHTVPDVLRGYSALMLTGGGDVDPFLYNASAAPETVLVNHRRDEQELELIAAFLRAGKAVFGICRGIQIINVALRGKLIQHVPAFLAKSAGDPEEHGKVGENDSVHALKVVAGSQLAAIAGLSEANSAHHQAVDPGSLGNGLRVTASSPRGIVEAVEGDGLPVIAVQWHPERMAFEQPGSSGLLRLLQEFAATNARHR